MEMKHMEDLCSLYSTLLNAAKEEVNGDLEHVDTQELGEVIDMVKDLAEAKKDCAKACYYETVVEAMNNSERRGYRASMRPVDDYSGIDESYYPLMDSANRWRMGYHEDRMTSAEDPRYGKAYNEYRTARKHYTETHNSTDKEEMERHVSEHVADTIATMTEIYRAAEPELKKRIKADFSKLVAEMV